jgi:uncharacterized protein
VSALADTVTGLDHGTASNEGAAADVALIVIAKEPVAGRAKTRLGPPCTPVEAAALAEAALADTLGAVAATPARRRVLALDGRPGGWLPAGFDVVAQRPGGLASRLAGAFAAVRGPALLIGMDTPQVLPELLERSAAALVKRGADAVLGPAEDGGYWAIGLATPRAGVFDDVPMSSAWTCQSQRARLRRLGLSWAELAMLRDVDTFDDALEVARMCPGSRFAAVVARSAWATAS